MNRCSTSLVTVVKEMQIKTTMRNHFIPARLEKKKNWYADKGIKQEFLSTAGQSID